MVEGGKRPQACQVRPPLTRAAFWFSVLKEREPQLTGYRGPALRSVELRLISPVGGDADSVTREVGEVVQMGVKDLLEGGLAVGQERQAFHDGFNEVHAGFLDSGI